MRRTRRTLATIAALAVVLAGAPAERAGAALRWAKPETLSPGFPGTVHIDARGDVLAVWQRYFGGTDIRTYYAWRPPRGDWTRVRQIEPVEGRVAVVLTPRGRATAAWNDGRGRLVAAEAQPGGAFAEPRVIVSGVSNTTVDLAADDAGNALAAWSFDTGSTRQNAGSTIFAATRRAGGAWSEPQDLSGDVAGGGPFVAVNAAGAAAVAWTTVVGGLPEIAYRPPAGSFGRPERSPLTGPTFPLHLAVHDDGNLSLAAGSRALTNDPARTQLATRTALGGWSPRFEFETAGAPGTVLGEPNGALTFLMDDASDFDHRRVQFATRSADGSVVGPVTLASDRVAVEGAMNLRGDILAAWHEYPGMGGVEVVERLRGGVFGLPVSVSGVGAVEPEVALNDARQAAVMWAEGGYTDPTLQVAVRDDPSLPVLPFPPEVDVDVPVVPELDGDGDLVVPVLCSTSCRASAEGILVPGGGDELRAGSGPSRRLKARRRTRLKLDFGTDGAEAARRALKAGRRPTAFVSVRARSKSPRPMTVSRRVRLR